MKKDTRVSGTINNSKFEKRKQKILLPFLLFNQVFSPEEGGGGGEAKGDGHAHGGAIMDAARHGTNREKRSRHRKKKGTAFPFFLFPKKEKDEHDHQKDGENGREER